MRILVFAIALILTLGHGASAFEKEDERVFSGADPQVEITVLSTTDTEIVAPLIGAFLAQHPTLSVRYVAASSQEVFRAVDVEAAPFDLVISSAMDLQMKLANDGYAAAFSSDAVDGLPDWARWRDRLFGFALEPVVLLASRKGLDGLAMPHTRRDLIDLLRDNPGRFNGRIGTYDPVVSGAGYLFATQDARQSDTFWRLAEVMGRLNTRLYCCSGDMIRDLRDGRLVLAYNVVGSYAATSLPNNPDAAMIELEDFTVALLRTAFIPKTAPRPDLGGLLMDFMLSAEGQRLTVADTGFPTIDQGASSLTPSIRPIRLDPGLLVYLDRIKKEDFLEEWKGAMTQP
jgi:iron(III) transport system substrate-binding protein